MRPDVESAGPATRAIVTPALGIVRKLSALLLASALLVASSRAAWANARYPASTQVLFVPNDPNEVIVRVTFGLMVSRDRGNSWRSICESAIGVSGIQDPMYGVTTSGTLIGALAEGVVVSSDQRCAWTFASSLARSPFVDLVANPQNRANVLVFASAADASAADAATYNSRLFETVDEGLSFRPLGAPLDPAMVGATVDLTKMDPNRIYVSGVRTTGAASTGLFLVSRDRGATFETQEVPLVGAERQLFIAAVDPGNAERVYVRTRGDENGPSRLLVTDDAGKTFRTAFSAKGPLAGFALAQDGSRIWAGGRLDGVQAASTTNFVFEVRSSLPVQCLAAAADGLWACSDEKNGFVVGLSSDDGATFTPKLHFCDVANAIECPAGSPVADKCSGTGPVGCIRDEPEDPSRPDAARAPDAGAVPSESTGGCGCRIGAPIAPSVLFGAMAFLGLLWFRARRRG